MKIIQVICSLLWKPEQFLENGKNRACVSKIIRTAEVENACTCDLDCTGLMGGRLWVLSLCICIY